MQTLQIEKQIRQSETASNVFFLVLSTVLTVCTFICLLCVFDLPCSDAFVIILSALIPLALFYLIHSKIGKYVNMVLPFLLAVYFAAEYNAIWKGYLAIVNTIITKVDRFNSYGILTYDTGSVANLGLYTTMALIPVILIFAYLTVISIKYKLFAPVILLTLPFILSVVYFHVYIAFPAVLIIFIVWIALLSNCLSLSSISLRTTAWVFAITSLFAVFVNFVIPYNKYTPSQKISNVRQSIVNGIDSLRYNYGIKKVQIDSLPNGDLKNAKTLNYTDEVVMKVKMQKPSAIYLKGYVGSVYSNNSWSSLPATAYSGNYTGLFEWLAKKNFYPQSQISSLCSTNAQLSNFGISVNNIALESKYIYTPYEAVPNKNLSPQNVNYDKDMGINSSGLFGTRSYSFSMYSPIFADYGVTDLNKWVKNNIQNNTKYARYSKAERAYRAFVYHNYLDVPVKIKRTIDSYFTKKTIDSLKNKDYRSVIDFLRRYYLQKFNYSSEIKNLPVNSDIVAIFLKTGSGYDVHFATLSVMLLRSAGIPARYVEGYYLPHNYVDIYSKTENATLDVKDSFAHAWAEIYVDGAGWIPVELTPGYYTVGKNFSKATGKDENVLNKNKNFYNEQENALTNDSAEKQHQAKKNAEFYQLCFEIAAILLIVIAISVAIFMFRAKKINFFVRPAKTKAPIKIYAKVVRLLKFDGIETERNSVYESSDKISRKFDQLTEKSFTDFLDLAYKARFGPVELDEEGLSCMQSYVKSLAKQIYVKQGFFKKLILKISGLI